MEDSDWVPVGLFALSKVIADLRSSVTFEECKLKLENLESEIQSASAKHLQGSVLPVTSKSSIWLDELIKEARNDIWDKVPIRAIANAHKERARSAPGRVHGNSDGDNRADISKVYIDYARYLLLYPQKDDAEYQAIVEETRALEDTINSQPNPVDNRGVESPKPSPVHEPSQTDTQSPPGQPPPGSLKKRHRIWHFIGSMFTRKK
ncbi:hypothetical protein MVEN_01655900 [Mycena venus]|uniref:Uncharacterized protein n=1 Tax=Mycena venus TaxID=2733690 RepID=A0A8H7CP36_9AGAR|nr:hypothetical protein MVEN_01655900 [Mycena venus]